jgi:hypothetical protein
MKAMKATKQPQDKKNNENQAQNPAKSPAAVPAMGVIAATAAENYKDEHYYQDGSH